MAVELFDGGACLNGGWAKFEGLADELRGVNKHLKLAMHLSYGCVTSAMLVEKIYSETPLSTELN